MILYQQENSQTADHIQIDIYRNFSFPLHLHRDMEFVLVIEGEIEVTVGRRTEVAGANDLILILSNELHAYRTHGVSKTLICPFSSSLVGTFNRLAEGERGDRSVFPCPAPLVAYLKANYIDIKPTLLAVKATLYAVCAEYLKCAELEERDENNELLTKLLVYVENNYREDITLSSVAAAIGYDEKYLSRYFHRAVNINFRRFINEHRIDYACQLMNSTPASLTSIAMESGFQSVRSFNRAFLEIVGKSPSAYMEPEGEIK